MLSTGGGAPSSKQLLCDARKVVTISTIMLKGILLFILFLCVCTAEAKKVGPCLRNVEGSRCYKAGARWQHDGVCIVGHARSHSCHVPETRHFTFILVVKMQQLNPQSQTIKSLWVRGSGPTLSWDKPTIMLKSARSISEWSMEISYVSDSTATLCMNSSYCSVSQQALEFRVYTNEMGTADMLGPNFYIPLPVSSSMSGIHGFVPPRVKVHPWFNSTKAKLETIKLSYKAHLTDEATFITSTILYPPSFTQNIYKKYPLVILLGTNELVHSLPLIEHLFVHEGSIDEAVVVSIHYLDKAPFCAFSPFNELSQMLKNNTVWGCKTHDSNCHTCQTCWDENRVRKCTPQEFSTRARKCLSKYACTGSAGDILDFIERQLLRELQQRTDNRLQLDFPRQRISIVGFSGGGLLACFAALTRPLYYGNAACLSAPFEWPVGQYLNTANRSIEGIGRLMNQLNIKLAIEPSYRALYTAQKYYIDVGELDNFYFPQIDAFNYTEWMVRLLREKLHLKLSENIMYFNVPKAGNSYYHHKDGGTEVLNRVRQPLLFFLKAKGGVNRRFPRSVNFEEDSFAKRREELDVTEQDLNEFFSHSNETDDRADHCSSDTRLRIHRNQQPSVPLPIFIGSIIVTIMVSVILTACSMCLREASKKEREKKTKEEEDELMEKLGNSMEELGSSMGDLD